MTNPLMDGATNAQFEGSAPDLPSHAGFDSMGENNNFQATDHATIDRHIH
jgi:hypothetical protein